MMTSSNGNIFALLAICAGNSPVTGEFPAQRPVTRNFDVFFDLRLNKRLSKQWWSWWFDTPSHPLWRHCNVSNVGLYNGCNLTSVTWHDQCYTNAILESVCWLSMVWCCLAPRHLEPPCSNRPASHIRITSDIMFMTNIGIHGEVYKSFHKMLWFFYHYGDIARAPILFKSPDTWLLVEKRLHDNNNESSNVRISGPLWGKSHLSDSKPQNIVTCNHKNMP